MNKPEGYNYTITESDKKLAEQVIADSEANDVSRNVEPEEIVTYNKDLKSDDEKTYILLLVINDDGEEIHEWDVVVGRTNAYRALRNRIEELNVSKSQIMTEGNPSNHVKKKSFFTEPKSVYKFMKYCIETLLVDDPGFDIDEYLEEEN